MTTVNLPRGASLAALPGFQEQNACGGSARALAGLGLAGSGGVIPSLSRSAFSYSSLDGADVNDESRLPAGLFEDDDDDAVDPLQLEKKIRGVQKKLRRVQQIEQQAGSGQALDSGQQNLLRSKCLLQASLQQLLEQWAYLEPALIEQQQQASLAIADSECAVCLEEYTADTPAIRTSCCGYHFHKGCLMQCVETKGQCPICSADKASCKVVEQRKLARVAQ
tara:strand:+ start:104 stop:769 length:666 start_codon:yes stop_codon:yes gene_type:complete